MAIINGTEFDDYLFGTPGDDEIFGGDGNDVLFGGDGDDIIYDGPGIDKMFGGNGNDTFKLFDSNLLGPSLVFDPGGLPELLGGPGYDIIDASEAIEGIIITEANFAIASVEEFIGSQFDDSVDASLVSFDVVLSGQGGNDTLTGGSGNDTLVGGPGADLLTGGKGSDVFVFEDLSDSLLESFDVISDLEIATDSIRTGTPIAAANLPQLGEVATLEAAAIAEVLTASAFVGQGAATFTFELRTFLAVNDTVAGYQPATDSIIEITGYSGDLANLELG